MCHSISSLTRLILAPMEGVLDAHVRELLTRHNQFDYCVTEFVRVTDTLLPSKVFFRLCPELKRNGKTSSGTPVRVQLLGHDPFCLADNAMQAIELGSYGIDLNAGCPAKTVTGRAAGAALLKCPETLYRIIHTIRKQIPQNTPLSVKIRLGWSNKEMCKEIAHAVESGGANEIVIHGRTKEDGYRADKIDWSTIGKLRNQLAIPVIANGDIFSKESAVACIQQSGCQTLMLGRGVLQTPNLANILRHNETILSWQRVLMILISYVADTNNCRHQNTKPFYHSARIKQWLHFLKVSYPEAAELLSTLKTITCRKDIYKSLIQYSECIYD